jgi:DNA-binding MarR family transcriptional regulator
LPKWVRFDANIIDNEMLQRLPPELFKAWVNLMLIAHERTLPPLEDIARRLRVDQHVAQGTINALIGEGLITVPEAGLLSISTGVEKSVNKSADRQRRYRERTKGRVTADRNEITKSVTADRNEITKSVTADRNEITKSVTADRNEITKSVTESGSSPAQDSLFSPSDSPSYPTDLSSNNIYISESSRTGGDARGGDTPATINSGNSLFELQSIRPLSDKEQIEWFEKKFWPIVWKKKSVGSARTAWKRKVLTMEVAEKAIAAAIEQGPEILRQARERQDGCVLHPSTWINGERWMDEPDEPASGRKPIEHPRITQARRLMEEADRKDKLEGR